MTHPEELLAGYVDGTLTEDERAAVEAHLETCVTCREEIDLATRAVAALAEVPDEPVPLGVTGPVIAEVRRGTARARTSSWRARAQWVAGLAAAAAVIALLAVSLPHLGGGATREGAGKGGLAASASTAPKLGAPHTAALVPLEIQEVDYREVSKLQALAEHAAATRGNDQLTATSPTPSYDVRAAEAAQACIAKAAGEGLTSNDSLLRLIQAKFKGKPAYLGVYLERPAQNKPPDQVVIWVASVRSCRLLSFSSKTI
jgi:hypothetical protein